MVKTRGAGSGMSIKTVPLQRHRAALRTPELATPTVHHNPATNHRNHKFIIFLGRKSASSSSHSHGAKEINSKKDPHESEQLRLRHRRRIADKHPPPPPAEDEGSKAEDRRTLQEGQIARHRRTQRRRGRSQRSKKV